MKHRLLGLATVLVLGGCSAQATDIPIELSPAQDQALADTLRALILLGGLASAALPVVHTMGRPLGERFAQLPGGFIRSS